MKTANWEFVDDECNKEQVVIRDIGPWDNYPSITNDAEQVVQKLYAIGSLKIGEKRRLFYYDSDGQLDRILHENGKFTGFAPGSQVIEPVEPINPDAVTAKTIHECVMALNGLIAAACSAGLTVNVEVRTARGIERDRPIIDVEISRKL